MIINTNFVVISFGIVIKVKIKWWN